MRKIKILIVDDEYLERTLIKMGIDWDKYGFEVIGEASSGEEALEIIETDNPDIIFTDICMPFMDGLELCKNIRLKNLETKIVIITGHRDFEYAQKAINYKVNDFILKPMDHEKIIETASKLKEEILEHQSFLKEFNNMKDMLGSLSLVNSSEKPSKCNDLITNAKKLIQENIASSELSLTEVANKLFINSSYLSRVFKQETGENVIDFIMKLRIKMSIEYLNNTNLKAYEIAELVGISDAHYFSICFKKYTGKSIQEFKKIILNE